MKQDLAVQGLVSGGADSRKRVPFLARDLHYPEIERLSESARRLSGGPDKDRSGSREKWEECQYF